MLYTKRVTLVFLTQFVCTLAFVIYIVLIVINFVEMFNTSLNQLHRKRKNDSWLQAQCKEPEFVHHMRDHIDLCETVERDALTNPYLTATQMALDGLHLCGSYSCEKMLITLTESLRLSIYAWIATFTIILVMLPLCILPMYRKWQRGLLLHEHRLGDNAAMPSVYIRDGVGNMYKNQFHDSNALSASMSSQSSHFITEPRHRRLLTDTNSAGALDMNEQMAYAIPSNQTRYLPHSHQM
jgi:hypothetical protein